MMNGYSDTEELLKSLADEDYARFDASVTRTSYPMLGIRKPQLHAIARKIARSDYKSFLKEKCKYFEQVLLHGLVAAYVRTDTAEHIALFEKYIPLIDDWEGCDIAAMKYTDNSQEYADWAISLACGEGEFRVRFGLVALLHNFVKDIRYATTIASCARVASGKGYYAAMAAAWLMSVLFLYDEHSVRDWLCDDSIDMKTRRMCIRKICDSFRVSSEAKLQVKSLLKNAAEENK